MHCQRSRERASEGVKERERGVALMPTPLRIDLWPPQLLQLLLQMVDCLASTPLGLGPCHYSPHSRCLQSPSLEASLPTQARH